MKPAYSSQIYSDNATITFKHDAEITLREGCKSRTVSFSKGQEVKGSLDTGLCASLWFFLTPPDTNVGDRKALILPNVYKVLNLVEITYPEREW